MLLWVPALLLAISGVVRTCQTPEIKLRLWKYDDFGIEAGECDPILVKSLAKFHRDHPGFRDGEQWTDDFWNQVEIDGAAIGDD
jgi:hypothetical protein